MDAATLFLIVTLAEGREAMRPVQEFPSVAACENFRVNADQRRPADMANYRHECRPHYRVSPQG